MQIFFLQQALFRALKTKHETPKYGLIYHASLIGQAAPKFKGKISRVLAAKSALSIRMDALGEGTEATIGFESRAKVSDISWHLLVLLRLYICSKKVNEGCQYGLLTFLFCYLYRLKQG